MPAGSIGPNSVRHIGSQPKFRSFTHFAGPNLQHSHIISPVESPDLETALANTQLPAGFHERNEILWVDFEVYPVSEIEFEGEEQVLVGKAVKLPETFLATGLYNEEYSFKSTDELPPELPSYAALWLARWLPTDKPRTWPGGGAPRYATQPVIEAGKKPPVVLESSPHETREQRIARLTDLALADNPDLAKVFKQRGIIK